MTETRHIIPHDPLNRVCDECGAPFKCLLGEYNRSRKRGYAIRFCSNTCRLTSQKTQPMRIPLEKRGKGCPIAWSKRTGQVFICERCGKSFYRYLADVRKAESRGATIRFCSKTCDNANRASTNRTCACERCGKTFTVWASVFNHAHANGVGAGRFCSADCRDVFMGFARRTAVMVPCATCGKMHRRIPASFREHMFCSSECMGAQVQTWTRYSYYGIGGIRPDLGQYFRSRWEANVARVLTAMGVPWKYEPMTFKCGGSHYTPDFHVGGSYWIEVKGYMSPLARRKIDDFRQLYPDEQLVLVTKPMYKAMQREWAARIPEWEHSDV